MFSDALDREAAWLSAYDPADGLPRLFGQPGDPFDVLQARKPRTPATRKNQLYVLRQSSESARIAVVASQRRRLTTRFLLELNWNLTSGQGASEADQLALEQAIDLVVARVQGPLFDKTHGGRFLSVAEDPSGIGVSVEDPTTSGGNARFIARVTYSADDPETNN